MQQIQSPVQDLDQWQEILQRRHLLRVRYSHQEHLLRQSQSDFFTHSTKQARQRWSSTLWQQYPPLSLPTPLYSYHVLQFSLLPLTFYLYNNSQITLTP